MRILIIDNNIDVECWGSQDLCRFTRMTQGATIYIRRGPQGDLPKDPAFFDRIIVSGSKTSALEDSPWISQLIEFIRKTIHSNTPYLGVCYGHQILARAINSKEYVRKSDTPEFGWTQIQIVEPSSLLQDIPKTFYSYSFHYDEVSQLPKGMRQLASSELCSIQACQLERHPVFGIQFHPERNLSDVEKTLKRNKEKGIVLPPFLNLGRAENLYDPKIGETIFKNFLELDRK